MAETDQSGAAESLRMIAQADTQLRSPRIPEAPAAAPLVVPPAAEAAAPELTPPAAAPAVDAPVAAVPLTAEPAPPAVPVATAAPAVPAPAVVDNTVADLRRQLADAQTQLASANTAAQRRQVNEALVNMTAKADAIAKEFGGEIGEFAKTMATLTAGLTEKVDAMSAAVEQNETVSVHAQAREGAPVMKALYNDVKGNAVYLGAARVISDQLLADPVTAEQTLDQHYAAVEAKMNTMFPTLKSTLYPGPAGAAPAVPAAAAPALPAVPAAPKVAGPVTLTDIGGGITPQPTKPADVGAMHPFDAMRYAATAPGAEIARQRNARH